MGSPLGPTLANLFLAYHEEKWLKECPVQFKPKFFRRYVDDVFLLFDNRDQVKKFLRYLNSRHRNIRFTYEEEQNDTLAFLDIKITRGPEGFTTSVYRKKTFSGVYLNFGSFLPIEYKKGLIATLLHRTYVICSDFTRFHEEVSKLKVIWQKNGFPLFFIDNCVKKFLDKLFIKKTSNDSPKKEVIFPMVFLGKITLQVKKKIQSTFKELCPGMKLKIVLSSPNRLRSGFVFKDKLPREMDSMLLYKFTCGTCNCTYIGETKRHFQVRSSEHMGLSILTSNLLKYNASNATAVRKHCNDLEHDNNIDNIQIVGHASNKFHLRLKESLLISMVNPTIINVQKKSIPLCVFGK